MYPISNSCQSSNEFSFSNSATTIRQSRSADNHTLARQLVIQTEHLSPEAAAWLGERCELVACSPDDARFPRLLANAAGLVVRTYTIVDEALLRQGPNVKVVGRAGAGLDNIDVAACRRRNVEVVYTPDSNTQAVVEYVIALVCDAMRPRITLTNSLDASSWNALRERTFGVRQMNELTIGILGLGRVGRRLAAVIRAIGCRVLYNDLLEIPVADRHGAQPVDVDALFTTSDVISIHIDGRPSNRHFVNGDLIALMKPDAILINTSRGFVIDHAALAEWLRDHPAALALLDVHDPEPFPPEYPLLHTPNARLYPHLASRTQTAMNSMSWVVKDVVAVLEGKKPQFPAPPEPLAA